MARRHSSNRRSHARGHRHAGADGAVDLVVGGPNAVEAALDGERATAHRIFVEDGAGHRVQALAARAREAGLALSRVGRAECDQICGVRAQGIAAEISYHYAELEPLLAAREGLLVFLDQISDPYNLGAIIRTAEAAGALGVVLPERRSAVLNATVLRASAGAAVHLPVCRVTNLVRAMEAASRAGFRLVGLDVSGPAELEAPAGQQRLGLVIGSEGEGMRRLVRESCDDLARLPMRGRTESLNASVAAALAIYRLAWPDWGRGA